jgi:hypothetical protein
MSMVPSRSSARPISRPEPFVLVGPLDEISSPARRLRMGDTTLTVTAYMPLEEFVEGERVVVGGFRSLGQAVAIQIRRAGDPEAPPAMANLLEPDHGIASIMSLVIGVLAELRGTFELLDCVLLPEDDRYAIRLQIPREMGKSVLIPRTMLKHARTDPIAHRTMRNLLAAAVEILRTQRVRSDLRGTTHAIGALNPHFVGPRCSRCRGSLFADDPILVMGGAQQHLACPRSW